MHIHGRTNLHGKADIKPNLLPPFIAIDLKLILAHKHTFKSVQSRSQILKSSVGNL